MPFKSLKKRRIYAKRWRQKHAGYMRDYYWKCVVPLGRKRRNQSNGQPTNP